jgi:hypothetical protein
MQNYEDETNLPFYSCSYHLNAREQLSASVLPACYFSVPLNVIEAPALMMQPTTTIPVAVSTHVALLANCKKTATDWLPALAL